MGTDPQKERPRTAGGSRMQHRALHCCNNSPQGLQRDGGDGRGPSQMQPGVGKGSSARRARAVFTNVLLETLNTRGLAPHGAGRGEGGPAHACSSASFSALATASSMGPTM